MPRIMQLVPIDGRLGVVLDVPSSLGGSVSIYTEDEISALLAVEREACAKIADGELMEVYTAGEERIAKSIAEQIRKRT